MRKKQPITSGWRFVKDAATLSDALTVPGEYVNLPHTWNAEDGQDGDGEYFRGTCWYFHSLEVPEAEAGEQVWLQFDGAAMSADVYLNGCHLAHHDGGYSTFRVDLTNHLTQKNLFAVSVDNSSSNHIYPQMADFTFYGGLYRDVSLVIVPSAHFALADGNTGLTVNPVLSDDLKTATVAVEAAVTNGEGYSVAFTLGRQTQSATVRDGVAQSTFSLNPVHLWNGLDDPYLYTVSATLDSGDETELSFGCRRFELDPQNGAALNGHPYPLRGVSRHQDRKGVGSALTPDMYREDIAILKELGATFLRLAHYQHAQSFYDLCDQAGIVVWAEIPYISQHMPEGRENTLSQMRELVTQCRHHPSILCWGLSNEVTSVSDVDEDLLENHRMLNELCHSLDPSRPTVLANVYVLEAESPLLEIPDLNSYNLYYGWYQGEIWENGAFLDAYHQKFPERCIGLSEYGADANPAFQSPQPERGDYTESYQCLYHEEMLELIKTRPWLWSTCVWNLFDFAADSRSEGGKKGENQKGLVTFDHKTKKDAFYLYRAYWSREPFVHLCGCRYVDRTEEVTEVKVYSNQPKVTLLVDGKAFAVQEGTHIFRFQVPLTGEHIIQAIAGDCTDTITVRKVSEANPAYQCQDDQEVVNWFDARELDPDCFSVQDTLGDLMANANAGPIINSLVTQITGSADGNENMLRMVAGASLQALLKRGGNAVPPELIRALNAQLQKIRKKR